ncbi:hypothetical protein LRM42_01895 [Candidatus Nanosynbacter sp. TM7-075]|uniref:hypothetical protein n=1 Tax=Candidatus Nanosynbacter sp. TM7-075 TaxID=2902633 RepID=UPI001FB84CE9|nr:hypothetical protein [Candidatus Nanosynbacter sp. TM7-075]MCJ1967062.1 hypothetical protein [Candidatus Nanosynbacter sp. TM7-075]
MEKPKPTQNHEQEQRKTLRDYVVATFHADLDIAKRPLTVIRSGKDKEDVIYEGGWVPSAMLCVCNTDPEKGAGPTELFVEVYKTIKVNGEHVPVTGIAPLNILRNLKENGVFTESYIQALYGKSTEEMLKEGAEAAERIWQQKHPDSRRIESLVAKKHPENSSNSLVVKKDGSDHERPSISKVSPKVGSTAVKAAGVRKPIDTNRVETNEPVKKPAVKATGIKKPVETGLDESDSPELNRFDERVRELMKPLETDVDGMPFENESVRVNYYDYLYDPNYVPSNNVEDAAVRNPKGVPVSENSFNAAKEAIYDLATNPSLMQIINPERALDPEVIINGVRSSHLTRCRLFEYLTSSLDRLAVVNPGALADRVLRDSYDNLKSPNYLGGNYYAGKMRSREYTVVLAIAMMDGSFDVDRQDKMVTHYRGGRERSGMHRDSARALLEYVRNNY